MIKRYGKRIVCAVLLLILFFVVAASRNRAIHALWLGPRGLERDALDDRIFVESGLSSQSVNQVRWLIDGSVARVELLHGRPFAEDIEVYLCATQASFNKRIGAKASGTARGGVFADRLFLSPRVFSTQTCQGILTHELSHLHFRQFLGTAYTTELPGWFQEGLAVLVADGGGAEVVSRERALSAVLAGNHFFPEDQGHRRPRMAKDHGLSHHMFYRQAHLFVEFLRNEQPASFQTLIHLLLDGTEFRKAFETAYQQSVMESWRSFSRSIALGSARQARRPHDLQLGHRSVPRHLIIEACLTMVAFDFRIEPDLDVEKFADVVRRSTLGQRRLS